MRRPLPRCSVWWPTYLAELVVPTPVLDDEVDDLDADTALDLGLRLLEPSIDQMAEAGERAASGGGLSFYDWLCLIIARDGDGEWIVLTNERRLLSLCKEHGIGTMRGLRLMLDLVEADQFDAAQALAIASEMCEINKTLGVRVLDQFRKALDKL
jgi:hypothetical protein